MRLLIAIPALNEEQSIGATIERTLTAARHLTTSGVVDGVDVTVVSDGSTDRTVEIASAYTDRVDLIVFDHNRGYGAAIKEAWARSDADLLGFLDADGTCDPEFFAPLCEAIESADITIGCRMATGSQMPRLRQFGNRCFSTLLSVLSSRRVRDTASGMRVVRRGVLPILYPLPDGLHFTPAMSARAMLATDIRLREVDMPYAEREGESKLAPFRDGLRFVRSILQAAVLFRPFRLLCMAAVLVALPAVLLLASPVLSLIRDGDWPAGVRASSASAGAVLLMTAAVLIAAGYVAQRIVEATLRVDTGTRPYRAVRRLLGSRWFWATPLVLASLGMVAGVLGALRTGGGRGQFSMVVLVALAALLTATRLLDRFVNVVGERLRFAQQEAPYVLAQQPGGSA